MNPILLATLLAVLGADGVEGTNFHRYESRKLSVVIGDNSALGEHKARYNGIYSLTTPKLKVSPFVPDYAGLNLEHYFDMRPDINKDNNVFFEPRIAPMTFKQIDEHTSELFQPETPYWGVESTTRFTVAPKGHIDLDFTCTPKRDHFVGGFLGVFWASYINAPEDKSIYFLEAGSSLDAPQWVQYCTQRHGLHSTVRGAGDDLPMEGPESTTNLFMSTSPLRYAMPFYYGRFGDQVLIFMYEAGDGGLIRLSHSPSGGGDTPDKTDTNPAWDVQLIVPNPVVGQAYGMKARLVVKPWKDRAEVLAIVRDYYGK
jgi:hypothetical protein